MKYKNRYSSIMFIFTIYCRYIYDSIVSYIVYIYIYFNFLCLNNYMMSGYHQRMFIKHIFKGCFTGFLTLSYRLFFLVFPIICFIIENFQRTRNIKGKGTVHEGCNFCRQYLYIYYTFNFNFISMSKD